MEKKIIVPARITDAVLIKNIDDVSFHKDFHEPLSYYEECFNKGYDSFLLMIDNLPAGEIILRFDDNQTLGLESFAIVPKFRGKDHSKFLLDFVDSFARPNFKRIVLEVHEDNKKAIDIYKKHGYNITHMILDFYKFGSNAHVMEKIL